MMVNNIFNLTDVLFNFLFMVCEKIH